MRGSGLDSGPASVLLCEFPTTDFHFVGPHCKQGSPTSVKCSELANNNPQGNAKGKGYMAFREMGASSQVDKAKEAAIRKVLIQLHSKSSGSIR